MKKTLFPSLLAALLLPLAARAQLTVDSVVTAGLLEPHSITSSPDRTKFYLTDAATHRVFLFDSDNGLLSAIAGVHGQSGATNGPGFLARFYSPRGIVAARGGLVVSDSGNHTIRFLTLTGAVSVVSTLAGEVGVPGLTDGPTVGSRFNSPVGLAADTAGNIYVADSKNNAVRKIDLANNVTTLATGFSEPNGIALDEAGQIFVADTRNNAVKLIRADLSVILLAGSLGKVAGTTDSYFATEALFNAPTALTWIGGTTGLLVSDTGSHTIRRVYANPIIASFFPELNGFSVETYSGVPRQAGLLDGSLTSARFNSPSGLTRDSEGGLFVADLGNRSIRRIQTAPRLPKIKLPSVGYVTFSLDPTTGQLVSNLNGFTDATFNNDAIIAVLDEPGTDTIYTTGVTPGLFATDTIPAPNSLNSLTAPPYSNGLPPSSVKPSIVEPAPDLTIKLVSTADDRRPSDLLQVRIQYKASSPAILGDNPASFTVTSDTTGAVIWYTLDGTTPTNQPPSLELGGSTVSVLTNAPFTFRARAFRDKYRPSEIATKAFSPTDFRANRISLGFERGEASSDFVASPGQRFYSPVTLSLLPGVSMYSLSFNLSVTNLAAAPAVTPGAIGFFSSLMEEKPLGSKIFRTIPPAMFITATDPPPTSMVFTNRDGLPFVDLLSTNAALNLLGVGWLERATQTNLYNTTAQDLITYSMPHDTIFRKAGGKVVAGAFAFSVPATAIAGDKYQVQVGRASATSDGIGGPNGSVFIDMPTNGPVSSAGLNTIKQVAVGQRRYVVGDVAPFRWFNAGDFGNTNLFNDDLMQVFQSAIYTNNFPIPGSDFFDAMDSCCVTGVPAPGGGGHVTPGGIAAFGLGANPLFLGSDISINDFPFGDGVLDVADVYVSFRRALDPSLTWYQRYWTNGVRGAEVTVNHFRGAPQRPAEEFSNAPTLAASPSESPSAHFRVPDLIISAGQTVDVPIEAQIHGVYPVRIALLNVEVESLAGTPPLSEPVQFTPHPALGQPSLTTSRGVAGFGGAWLSKSTSGLKGSTAVGTLRIKLPSDLPPDAAYRVHFTHLSASPNGLAIFPRTVQDGLLLVRARDGSRFQDGIPDSWRLRYFGAVDDLLSQADADADGDGLSNAVEFKAGTNPVDLRSSLQVHAGRAGLAPRQGISLRWLSARGKTYAIEGTHDLGADLWQSVAPNVTGTGVEMEITAPSAADSATQFYRVRLVE